MACKLGELYGYRNSQTTVLAPTGTIGLLMDCDTTGIEPDFALVKFKKLAGGGYFKIVNQSVPKALQRLGYTEAQVADIVSYVTGTNTFTGAPHCGRKALLEAGLTEQDVAVFIGVGGVGGFGAQLAKSFGAAVVAIDVDQKKLDNLAPYMDAVFNVVETPFKELRKQVYGVAKKTGRARTHLKIFETSGTAAGQNTAYGLMTFGAHLSVVGFTLDKVNIRLSNLMAFNATARGNWGCVPEYYRPVVDLILEGKIDLKPFVKTFPLDSINDIFEQVHAHKINQRPILVP